MSVFFGPFWRYPGIFLSIPPLIRLLMKTGPFRSKRDRLFLNRTPLLTRHSCWKQNRMKKYLKWERAVLTRLLYWLSWVARCIQSKDKSSYTIAINTFTYLRGFPSIRYFYGDGYQGLPTYAPFDKIIVTAAAPQVPEKLLEQLKPGGKMVIPVGEGKIQQMLRIHKDESGVIHEEIFDNFSFVPMLQGKNI